MRDDDPKAIALDLMARATVHQMQDDARELAELCQERPLPDLPADDAARVRILLGELVYERHRVRTVLALLAG